MFKGKTVLVTGGSGYLGSEICRTFAGYGAEVVFTYGKNEKAAKALQKEIKKSKAIQVNMRDVKDITDKIEALPRVDVLINNAGTSAVMPLALLEEEDVDLMLDVNVKGMIFATRAAARGMIHRRGGVIINMGSLAGERMLDVPATYAASKAAAGGFTVALASELKRFNIRVNCVVPGMMEGGVAKAVPEELRKHFIEHCAAGRIGTAKDVAETVCFLASDKASYINGQKLFVDGGV